MNFGEIKDLSVAECLAFALRQAVWLCGTAVVIGAFLFVPITGRGLANAAESHKAFCSSQTAHNYAKPLEEMKPIHRVPASGKLPFAPSYVKVLRTQPVAARGGPMGFVVVGNSESPVRLNWIVSARLSRINRDGAVQRVMERRQQSVSVSSGSWELDFTARKFGLFRVDLTIKRESDEKLAHYAEYFRRVPQRLDIRLGVAASSYRPGDLLSFHLENFGTTEAEFDSSFALERQTGSIWALDPASPEGATFPTAHLLIGEVSKCLGWPLPPDLAPGHYRILKGFKSYVTPQGKMLYRTAEFDVVP